MPDAEVEATLNEIRERVRVQIRSQALRNNSSSPASDLGQVNGHALESLRANLAIIERSWNRLPPLVSYRRGWLARLELWLKRGFKRAVHWFTWEQVNFNSATSNSFRDVLTVLSAQEQTLADLNDQLRQLSAATIEIQSEPQTALPTVMLTDGLEPQSSAGKAETGAITQGENTIVAPQPERIDREIEKLAARIEELKKIKLSLERIG